MQVTRSNHRLQAEGAAGEAAPLLAESRTHGDGEQSKLTLDALSRGLGQYLSWALQRENDDELVIDEAAADAIVQFAIFGEVQYG